MLPWRIRDVLTQRIDSLTEAGRTLLRAASVLGREFDPSLAGGLVGLDGEDLIAAGEDILLSGLVVETSSTTVAFSHALVQAAVETQLSALRRIDLHRRRGNGPRKHRRRWLGPSGRSGPTLGGGGPGGSRARLGLGRGMGRPRRRRGSCCGRHRRGHQALRASQPALGRHNRGARRHADPARYGPFHLRAGRRSRRPVPVRPSPRRGSRRSDHHREGCSRAVEDAHLRRRRHRADHRPHDRPRPPRSFARGPSSLGVGDAAEAVDIRSVATQPDTESRIARRRHPHHGASRTCPTNCCSRSARCATSCHSWTQRGSSASPIR